MVFYSLSLSGLANSLTEKLHSSSGVMVRNRQFNQSNPSSQIDVALLYLLFLQRPNDLQEVVIELTIELTRWLEHGSKLSSLSSKLDAFTELICWMKSLEPCLFLHVIIPVSNDVFQENM